MRLVLRVVDARTETDLELEGAACLLDREAPFVGVQPDAAPAGRACVYEAQGAVLLQRLGAADAIRINDRPVGETPCQLFDHDLVQVGACTWQVAGAVDRDSTGATEIYLYPEEQPSGTGAMHGESVDQALTRLARGDGEYPAATAIAPASGGEGDETRLVTAEADEREVTRLLPAEGRAQMLDGGDATQMNRDTGPLFAVPGETRLSADRGGDSGATVLDNGSPAQTGAQHRSRSQAPLATRLHPPHAGGGGGRRRRLRVWLVLAGLTPAMIYIAWLVLQGNVPPPQTPPAPAAMDLVREHLATGQVAALPAQLLRLQRAQPSDVETRRLLEDANRLQDLLYLRDTRQWGAFAVLRDRSFHTDLFEQAARHRVDREVMGVDSLRRYNRAAEAWREGQLVDALNGMRALARGASGSAGVEALAHYRGVVEGSHKLAALRSDPRYGAALVAHYLDLEPVEDAFYWARLPADLAAANPPLASAPGEVLAELAGLWRGYRQGGGISSALRQRPGSSEEFRQRAAELEGACRALARLAAQSPAVGEPAALYSRYLPRRLREERAYQRGRLQSLLAVNADPDLKRRLQALRPNPGCDDV
ncbi:hypothetical protein [Parahaliea mediterranea]|uniref:FHA domain-containing protein n=1 Tax=Parahaliea mediterranea TaxID=651086 RepID=A0A939DBG9_9GAMM|nr:hypothetical protein [Parahaliea mediterranea]MBN7794995.1 hypothetical protein [Parahaliea mediterranea]